MTRINTIHVSTLLDQHLLAEWRELPRIINELRQHPRRLKLSDIPPAYTMGKGHVTFFRNKLLWLVNRHKQLTDECLRRGFAISSVEYLTLDGLAPHITMFCCNDWRPSYNDHMTNLERIQERFDLRKRAYTFNGKRVDCEHTFNEYLRCVEGKLQTL